jgi:hypothetical protein
MYSLDPPPASGRIEIPLEIPQAIEEVAVQCGGFDAAELDPWCGRAGQALQIGSKSRLEVHG